MEEKLDIAIFTDGKGTPYEAVIKSIRDYLTNIEELRHSVGGAIIFFKKRSETSGDLMMKVFPFRPNVPFLEKSFTSLSCSQKALILKKINEEKPYHEFWHYANFKQNFANANHCKAIVPDKNVVVYDHDYIESAHERMSWPDFYQKFADNEIEKNTYEQLLFCSGCREVSFIPLPVLSTPSILLVLNQSDVDANRNQLLKSLYYHTRESITKHIYTKLIRSLSGQLDADGEVISEAELVQKFVDELSDVMLPISYSINNRQNDYYQQWPHPEPSSLYEIDLLENKYKIIFKLTSFAYVNLDPADKNGWPMIHTSTYYKNHMAQSSTFIEELFTLIFQYWKKIKETETRVNQQLLNKLSTVPIQALINVTTEINAIFQNLSKQCDSASITYPNLFTIEENSVRIIFQNEEVITERDKLGKNQLRGFKYLHYVMRKGYEEKTSISVTPEELFDYLPMPMAFKKKDDVDIVKRTAKRTIADNLDDVLEHLLQLKMNLMMK